MGDGAQPCEEALVQDLLEVPLADVLEERSVLIRWPSIAQHSMAASPAGGQAHQHGGAQIELLGQLCDVDVHRDQVIPVRLLHLADDVCQPFKLPLRACDPDEIDLWHMGVRLRVGPAPLCIPMGLLPRRIMEDFTPKEASSSRRHLGRALVFQMLPLTFLHSSLEFMEDLKTRSLRMDAKGVTPMPPPTSTDTSNLFHSWWPSPKGPSR